MLGVRTSAYEFGGDINVETLAHWMQTKQISVPACNMTTWVSAPSEQQLCLVPIVSPLPRMVGGTQDMLSKYLCYERLKNELMDTRMA